MKKIFWIYFIILFVTVGLIDACNSRGNKEPETIAKKNATPVVSYNIKLEALLKPTNELVVSSLPVTTPMEGNINIPVKVYGTIEYDTRAAGSISANVSGRIEKLYLRYRYQKIEAGQTVDGSALERLMDKGFQILERAAQERSK